MAFTGQVLTSRLGSDGQLTVELAPQTVPDPTGHEVVIRVEAAPINPSDLGLLFGPVDPAGGEFSPGRIVAPASAAALAAQAARLDETMPVGNEGAGTVVAAGDAPAAQALLGKRVSTVGGAMFARFRLTDARACMVLPDHVSAEAGAAAFVNPLTALGFVETMRRDGFSGIVHTAAASNLGQMLVKLCAEEGVPLVNIVRSAAQEQILRAIGAEHVVDSTAGDFDDRLVAAIRATGAMLAFDAIGGGKLAGRILTAMEQVASEGAVFSRYGSETPKKVYVYGTLDPGPTILNRTFGFTWNLSGWLLTPFLQHIGVHGQERLRSRVADGLTTVFASTYTARITLEQMLERDTVLAYNAKRTGEKYLLVPNG